MGSGKGRDDDKAAAGVGNQAGLPTLTAKKLSPPDTIYDS